MDIAAGCVGEGGWEERAVLLEPDGECVREVRDALGAQVVLRQPRFA